MIHYDRSRVPEPAILRSPRIKTVKRQGEIFFSRPKQVRLQERFEFPWRRVTTNLRELWKPLNAVFYNKCVYCESPLMISSKRGSIELFRPKSAATGLIPADQALSTHSRNWISRVSTGEDRDGYWWLAYDWENIYVACDVCSRNKRNQFPVIGHRAAPGTRGATLRQELALLLDPCADDPEEYLIFDEAGTVAVRKPAETQLLRFHGFNRGEITIDVLGLNRPELVRERAMVAKDVALQWKLAISKGDAAAISDLISPSQPYCAVRRGLIREWFRLIDPTFAKEMRQQSMATAPRFASRLEMEEPISVQLREPAAKRRKARKRRPKLAVRPSKQQTVGFINSISIRNFKAIRDLTISMSTGTERRIGWKVLLGENGTGKSTILQAVALALMGPAFLKCHLHEFRLRPVDLLRKVRGTRTAASGSITVEFSTGQKCSLHIFPRRTAYLISPPKGIFLRGYGAMRLLPRRNAPTGRLASGQVASVRNLFNPSRPVFNADRWLSTLRRRRKDFASAALSLKDLLSLPGFAKLRIVQGRVIVPLNGLKHSLDELSAGYESVLAVAMDIIAANLSRSPDLRNAPGIVLLDEIDAHLHPRWKMQIVDSLRRAFPSMQFLVTTHEPLCLRGIEKGEVVVLERSGKHVTTMEDLPAPSSMRVDQLLTSNFFGLGSTMDPSTEKQLNRYYELLAKPSDQLTTTEKKERDRLRAATKYEYRLMTDTQKEELVYEALDEYVAKDTLLRGEARQRLPDMRAETKERVAKLWSQYKQAGGVLA